MNYRKIGYSGSDDYLINYIKRRNYSKNSRRFCRENGGKSNLFRIRWTIYVFFFFKIIVWLLSKAINVYICYFPRLFINFVISSYILLCSNYLNTPDEVFWKNWMGKMCWRSKNQSYTEAKPLSIWGIMTILVTCIYCQ